MILDLPPKPALLLLPPRPAIIQAAADWQATEAREKKRLGILMPTGLMLASGGAPCAITYQAHPTSSGSTSTPSFSSVAIGTASADRYVFVLVHTLDGSGGHPTISAITIGGISGSVLHTWNNNGVTTHICAALVPTGTTATIAITLSASVSVGTSIGVYSVTGLQSTTPLATAHADTSATQDISLTTSDAKGFMLAAEMHFGSGGAFTGFSTTSDYTATLSSGNGHGTGKLTTGGAVTQGVSGLSSWCCSIAASFR